MRAPLNILITGAGSGFGRGATEILMARGHQVIAAVQNSEQAEELGQHLKTLPGQAQIIELDLEQPEHIAQAAGLSVDVLVNNAGFGAQGPISDSDGALVRRAFEVNVFGPLNLTQQVLTGMRTRGVGRIVFVSSVAGLFVGPGAGGYTMSKHALDAMAVEFQQELRGSGIEVRILNPGPYQTGFNERLVENAPSEADQHQRLLSNQSDPAEAIALLAGLADGSVEAERVISPERFGEIAVQARAGYLGIG